MLYDTTRFVGERDNHLDDDQTSLLFDFIELVCDNLRHRFLRFKGGTNI